MWRSRIPAVAGVFRSAALPEADMVRVRVGLVRRQCETRSKCSRENCGQNWRGENRGTISTESSSHA